MAFQDPDMSKTAISMNKINSDAAVLGDSTLGSLRTLHFHLWVWFMRPCDLCLNLLEQKNASSG